jgi:hypothetical protein
VVIAKVRSKRTLEPRLGQAKRATFTAEQSRIWKPFLLSMIDSGDYNTFMICVLVHQPYRSTHPFFRKYIQSVCCVHFACCIQFVCCVLSMSMRYAKRRVSPRACKRERIRCVGSVGLSIGGFSPVCVFVSIRSCWQPGAGGFP